ncbi:MAG: nuclear transport factor 2 family protein [Deltaproteobacteria bacterium]|nr:nuclear transport factor 2 family protein [Deltaproteobacteria bacterium]
MNEDSQKAVIEGYIAAYNAFDVDGMLAFIHPKVVFKNITGDGVNAQATGVDELRTLAEQSKSLFSSRCQEITSFSSDGAAAAVDIKFEGVLAIDLPNGMKAGDILRVTGRSEFQFREGKLFKIIDFS